MTASPPSEDAAALNARGNALFAEGRHAEAAEAYRRALALAPGRAVLQFNLGNALDAAGDARGAEGCFRAAIALAPDLGAAHTHLGNLLRRLDRPGEALEAYMTAQHMPRLRYGIDRQGARVLGCGAA